MKLSRASALGVFAAVHLARNSKAPVGGNSIAQALDVPVDSLLRVLQTLAKARILRSTRGRGGGFSLDRAPKDITLLCIVEAIDGPVTGGLDGNAREVSGPTPSKSVIETTLQEASTFTKNLLRQTTLVDLLPETEPLPNLDLQNGSNN